ncbi:MAG: radical SAM protein [Chloroflexota bacterium]|nr:radical SAM protein [Dehalococcoidia bacterium]MDW8254641.1 radical SAM protein [Chloroflexota bacterium]
MLEQLKFALSRKETLDRPVQLNLFITDACNARCGHCFNWRALNQGEEGLTLEEIERLAAELGALLSVGISGGEPFLRKDLAQVFGLFAERGLTDFTVPTNGLMPKRVRDLVRAMIEQHRETRVAILLSLDGLGELHDRIRGVPGNFQKVKETYEALVALKRAYPDRPPILKVGTVLCNWNIEQVPALIEWVQAELPEIDFHNFEIMRGSGPDDQLGAPSVAQLEAVKPHIFRAWDRYAFYGKNAPFQSWLALGLKRYIFTLYIEIMRQQKQLIPCYAGTMSAVVDASANLYFCEIREPIGNLRDASFAQLWRSEKAEQIRASIRRGECWCVHSCFQQKNVYANPRLWPHIVRYLITGTFTLPPPDHLRPLPNRPATFEDAITVLPAPKP